MPTAARAVGLLTAVLLTAGPTITACSTDGRSAASPGKAPTTTTTSSTTTKSAGTAPGTDAAPTTGPRPVCTPTTELHGGEQSIAVNGSERPYLLEVPPGLETELRQQDAPVYARAEAEAFFEHFQASNLPLAEFAAKENRPLRDSDKLLSAKEDPAGDVGLTSARNACSSTWYPRTSMTLRTLKSPYDMRGRYLLLAGVASATDGARHELSAA